MFFPPFRNVYVSPNLVSLVHSLGNVSHVVVNLAGRCTEDQITDGISCHSDVGIGAKHVNASVGYNDAGSGGILNGKTSLTILTSDTTNGTGQVIATQELDVGNLERFNVQIVQSKEGHGVLHFEAQHKSGNEIGSLLQRAGILGVVRGLHLHAPGASIEPNLQLEIFHERHENLLPVVAKGVYRCAGQRTRRYSERPPRAAAALRRLNSG